MSGRHENRAENRVANVVDHKTLITMLVTQNQAAAAAAAAATAPPTEKDRRNAIQMKRKERNQIYFAGASLFP